jgi:hypothetical protein
MMICWRGKLEKPHDFWASSLQLCIFLLHLILVHDDLSPILKTWMPLYFLCVLDWWQLHIETMAAASTAFRPYNSTYSKLLLHAKQVKKYDTRFFFPSFYLFFFFQFSNNMFTSCVLSSIWFNYSSNSNNEFMNVGIEYGDDTQWYLKARR